MNPLYYPDRELLLGTNLEQVSKAISAQLRRESMLAPNERFVIKRFEDMGKSDILLEGDVERIVYN